MNRIQITGDSMNIRNQGLAHQLQTSNVELSRSQTEVSHLRTSVGRNESTENLDAENLLNSREENRIERLICSLQRSSNGDGAYSVLVGRRATYYEHLELRCRRNMSNSCRITRCYSIDCRTHRWRHISVYPTKFLSLERSFFVSIRSFSSDDWWKTDAKRRTK